MPEIAIPVTGIEGERASGVSRFVIQRAALRGEIRFRLLPGGRLEFDALDVQRYAATRVVRGRSRGRRDADPSIAESADMLQDASERGESA